MDERRIGLPVVRRTPDVPVARRWRRRALSTLSVASLTLGLGSFVAFAPGATASAQATVQGHGYSVNLRAAPSTSAPVVGSEPDGAKVTIVCTSRGDTVNGNW